MPRIVERYDTNDQYDWSYTRTSYSKGKVAEVYTLYDDGTEGVQSFNRGDLVSEIRTDNPNDATTNPWSEIRTIYDANGDPASVHTTYDNGTTQDDQYSGGVITSSVLIDDPAVNAEAWQRIERQYDSAGQVSQQITVYDDGTVLEESFSNGVIASSVLHDNPAASTADWDRIEQQFDAAGQLQQQITYFDNGTVLDEEFTAGRLSSSVHYDDPTTNAESWERIESEYDSAGQLTNRATFNDNGTVLEESFSGGVLQFSMQYDDPATNAEDWEQIASFYDATGDLSRQDTLFDNGIVEIAEYMGGTISHRIQYDSPTSNAAIWDQIESFYDATGQLMREVTTLDSGVIDDKQFQNGTLTHRFQYDDPYTNSEDWELIETIYDWNGTLQQQVITYDNGVIDDTQYINGTISQRYQFDDPYSNAEDWELIESIYDGTGQLQQQIITYDTGVIDDTQYINGTISQRYQFDDPYTNAEDWELIESHYDGAGQLERMITTFDNGTIDDVQYLNGVIDFRVQFDDPYTNAEDWELIESQYDDNGQLEQQLTIYDTGVIDDMQFYDGQLSYRVQYDDPYTNAEDWQRIETYYDGAGQQSSQTTYYDDGRVTDAYFENGQLLSETTYDDPYGPNAYDWAAQVFEYTTDGQVALAATLYDNGDYARDDYDANGALAIHWDYDGDGDQAWLGRRVDYAPDGSELDTTYWYEGDPLPPELSDSGYVMY